MKCAINMDQFCVMHVGTDVDTLHGLVYLECGNVRNVRFEDTQMHGFLRGLDKFQLTTLHKNMTGNPLALPVDQMRAAIAVEVEAMRLKPVDLDLLDVQIASVQKNLELGIGKVLNYKYRPGGKTPTVGEPPVPLKADVNPNGNAARSAALQRLTAPPPPVAPAPAQAPQRRENQGGSAVPGGPPTMGVGATIWAVGDRMWAEAGKPRERDVILKLRLKMYEVLQTEYEVNRNTASNTLGDWMRFRLSEK